MKFFDKLGLTIFSTIVLIISIIMCTLVFGWLDVDFITDGIDSVISSVVGSNILLGVLVVLILLAIKCIFFNSYSREEMKSKEGILLENDNGKLLISRDTIENLANAVVKNYESAENVTTKVEVDKETNIKILITLYVHQDAIIKDLTSKLQADVKEAIKKSLNLEVKEVTIKVRDIAVKKEPTIKE